MFEGYGPVQAASTTGPQRRTKFGFHLFAQFYEADRTRLRRVLRALQMQPVYPSQAWALSRTLFGQRTHPISQTPANDALFHGTSTSRESCNLLSSTALCVGLHTLSLNACEPMPGERTM